MQEVKTVFEFVFVPALGLTLICVSFCTAITFPGGGPEEARAEWIRSSKSKVAVACFLLGMLLIGIPLFRLMNVGI